MNWIIALVAIVAAADLPQRIRQLREFQPVQRAIIGVGALAAGLAAAAVATPVLDALDVSSPTMGVAAGMVLILWSLVAFFLWSDDPAPPAVAGGLVPGLFPIVLTPALGVVLVGVGARNGLLVPVVASVVVGGVIAVGELVGGVLGRRSGRRVSATAGVVMGVVMMTDGVLAV